MFQPEINDLGNIVSRVGYNSPTNAGIQRQRLDVVQHVKGI